MMAASTPKRPPQLIVLAFQQQPAQHQDNDVSLEAPISFLPLMEGFRKGSWRPVAATQLSSSRDRGLSLSGSPDEEAPGQSLHLLAVPSFSSYSSV